MCGLARVLRAIGERFPRPAYLGPTHKPDALKLACQEETCTPESLQVFFERPEFKNSTLLDLGCGLGGKTAYYAVHGAKHVIGLEIDRARAQTAHRHIRERGLSHRVSIVMGDAARLPLRRGSMDLVLATDTWEHLLEPDRALAECLRVTATHGTISIYFMPFYSPWGAHAWDWIRIPWLQLFLPNVWFVAAVCEVERKHKVNTLRDVPLRINWHNTQDSAHTRKLTVSQFIGSVRRLGIQPEQLTILPIGSRAWRPVSRLIGLFGALPGFREVLTGLVVCVLRPIRAKGTDGGD
jgi:ubiquinone/menaquinone biosynthesis C-methylase UbiE